tara:strand:- start:43 stop:477 length:435 start_codon:yes stop_codon:yes gene_type:complete
MAHFVKLDDNNIVEQCIVVGNQHTSDASGNESEAIGIAFCQRLFGVETNWKQTSYNDNMRGNYAGIGMTYMTGVRTLGVASTDIFIGQQPYPSWSVGIQTAQWYAPTPPGDQPELTDSEKAAGKFYVWSESNYNSNPSTAWVLT